VPFPALVHETLLAPFAHPRDAGGYDGFLEDTAPLRAAGIPFLFAAGNHDSYHRADREALARYFGPPDPSPQAGPAPGAGGPQLGWLDARLSDATARGLRSVVVVHIPPFSSGREEGGAPWVAERLVGGVLDRHPVALVISGHVHAYERLERPGFQGRPVAFVVSGGGGGRFFHARAERDPRSIVFVEEVRHFVMLDLGPDGVDGRMVPVEVPGSPAVAGVASSSPSTTAPAS
jgi:hypothetical protein